MSQVVVNALDARAEKLLLFLLYPYLLCDPDLLAYAKTRFCKPKGTKQLKNENGYMFFCL
jgi:hypothetical protein